MVNRSMKQYGISPISETWAAADFDLLHLEAEPVEPHHDERLVTVIMTAHKDNPMMNKAVTSILQQSYVNLELLIIDDASAKEDVKVYEAFEASDERIRILRMSENSGTYAGKNYGLKHAKGEFITFMDSDDWQHPQKIEKIVGRLDKNPNAVAGFESYVRLMPDGELAQIGSWFVRKCLMGTVWKRALCWKPLADLTRFACPLIRNCWNGRNSSLEKNASFTRPWRPTSPHTIGNR